MYSDSDTVMYAVRYDNAKVAHDFYVIRQVAIGSLVSHWCGFCSSDQWLEFGSVGMVGKNGLNPTIVKSARFPALRCVYEWRGCRGIGWLAS